MTNEAVKYGVRIEPYSAPAGQYYWKCVRVYHLSGADNHGQSNVFLTMLNENGSRAIPAWVGWTWEGRRPDEKADPVNLDKPPSDYAPGNLNMGFYQTVSVWALGPNRDSSEPSDRVIGLHTRHDDNPPEQGNYRGHHSFHVIWRWTKAGGEPIPPVDPPPIIDPPDVPCEDPLTDAEWTEYFRLTDKLKEWKSE